MQMQQKTFKAVARIPTGKGKSAEDCARLRRAVLYEVLGAADKGGLSPRDLCAKLTITYNSAKHYVEILRDTGLVGLVGTGPYCRWYPAALVAKYQAEWDERLRVEAEQASAERLAVLRKRARRDERMAARRAAGEAVAAQVADDDDPLVTAPVVHLLVSAAQTRIPAGLGARSVFELGAGCAA